MSTRSTHIDTSSYHLVNHFPSFPSACIAMLSYHLLLDKFTFHDPCKFMSPQTCFYMPKIFHYLKRKSFFRHLASSRRDVSLRIASRHRWSTIRFDHFQTSRRDRETSRVARNRWSRGYKTLATPDGTTTSTTSHTLKFSGENLTYMLLISPVKSLPFWGYIPI